MTERKFPYTLNRRARERKKFITQIHQRLNTTGLTRVELDSQKDEFVGRAETLGEYIETSLHFAEIEWRDGKLVSIGRKVIFKLTQPEEDILQQKARELGVSPEELIDRFINKGLTEND